jgi:sugar/nucleoside kinase (ribokinase family)
MAKETPTVIGGLTMDLSYYVNRWPKVREAIQAKSFTLVPGGKGLNLATAISR